MQYSMAPRAARGGGRCCIVQQSNKRVQLENSQHTTHYTLRGSSLVGSDYSTQAPDNFHSKLGGSAQQQHGLGDNQEAIYVPFVCIVRPH